MKKTLQIALVSLLSPLAQGASYAIISEGKSELVGTSAAVPGSGSSSNFSAGTITIGSSHASFRMVVSGTADRYADLVVTVVGVHGTLNTGGGRSGVMVAQTENSQNLTDSGTISILTGFSSAGAGGQTSVTFRFDFFEPDTSTPKNIALELTSFDFDYRQFLSVSTTDFFAEAHGNRLTKTISGTTVKWSDDGNTDSVFTDSRNAVVLNNVPDSSFQVTVGKVGTGNALFMFEFRDPSQILDNPLVPLPIPEPSSSVLVMLASAGLLFRRRPR